ncbi:MAG TPA: 30S ribosomal protein S17 [Candidatus Dojkabacteria bacterium]|nr:30S ribosomal protein S17 [Candidatus Dojkabacteria bacterium]
MATKKTTKPEVKSSNRRVIEAKVVSNKMEKTVKVVVETKTMHPVYKKVMNKRKVYFAHTEKPLNEGDMVKIKESRPYSKNVKWVVVE